jgi:hypothetical protein
MDKMACCRHAAEIGRIVMKSGMSNRTEDRHRVGGSDLPGGGIEVMSEGRQEGGGAGG